MGTPQDRLTGVDDLFDAPKAAAPSRRALKPKPRPAEPVVDDLFDSTPAPSRASRPAAASPAPAAPRAAHPYGAIDSRLDGDWSLQRRGAQVKDWYRQTYNRDLPVTAQGQSRTHNARELDHSDALDVGINPTSTEGKALREYLRSQGIPFLAFDRASAAATGPHIHIGRPSHKGAAGYAASLGAVEDLFDSPDVEDLFDGADPLAGVDVQPDEEVVREASPLPSPPVGRPLPSDASSRRARRDASVEAERGGGGLYRIPVGRGTTAQATEEAASYLAKEVDAPVEFVRGWLGQMKFQDLQDGQALTSSPTGYATVSPEMVGQLRRDYSASLNLPTRAVRNVSEVLSTHRPGEMFVETAALATRPAGAALSKGAEGLRRATKPLDMFSARLWTRLGGGTPEQARAASDAVWNDEPLPAYAENFVAQDVERDMAKLNPRIGVAYGALTRFLTDPTNFVPVGGAVKLADKFADGVRAYRAARRAEEVAAALADVERVVDEAADVARAGAQAERGAGKAALEGLGYKVERTVAPNRGAAGEAGEVWKLTDAEGRVNIMQTDAELDDFADYVTRGSEGAGAPVASVDDLFDDPARTSESHFTAGDGQDVVRYQGRDIVRVEMPDGTVQPFYRSTGNNSKRAGEWFPFDGVEEDTASEMGRGWLRKDRFGEGVAEDPRHPLHRYGSDELRAHGESLRGRDVPAGREVSTPEEVNDWLRGSAARRSAADVAEDIRVTHARERADFYTREAANAKDPVQRAEAERLAREYADEAEEARVSDVARRVKRGDEVAPEEMADLERAVIAEDGAVTYAEVNVSPAAGAVRSAPVRAARSPLRRAFDAGLDAFDATKSMFASFDFSAAGRQAFVPFLFDTRSTLRGLLKGSPSALPGWHNNFVRWLDSQPDAKMWRDLGLDLDTMTGSGTHNEFFTSRVAEKIPGYGSVVIKPSDHVMTAQLDAVRLHVAQSWDETLRGLGATPETHPEDYKAVARLINVASGRAELGKVGQAIYPVTRRVIYSPKLLKSRFTMLNPLTYARLPPVARKAAGMKLGKAAAKMAGVLGLAYLTADEVGLNPFKSNFGLARYGNTTYDLTGGEGAKLRTVFQLVYSVGATANAYRKGEPVEYKDTPWGIGGHFLRSQLAPSYSLPVDAVTGETFDHKPFTWTRGVLTRITPGFTQDVYDGFVEGSGPLDVVKTFPSFLGISTRTRNQAALRREWAAAREGSKIAQAKERTATVLKDAPAEVRDELQRLRIYLPESDAEMAPALVEAAQRVMAGRGWAQLGDAQRKTLLENILANVRRRGGTPDGERTRRAASAKDGEQLSLTGSEVKRLGVVIDPVFAGHSVKVFTGESVKFKGENVGQTPEMLNEYRRRLAEATQKEVERVMAFGGYGSKSDQVRRAALQAAVDRVKTRLRGQLHFETRRRDYGEHERLEEYQRTLEGRSRQLKPGETLKLGEEGGGSGTVNRSMNFEGGRGAPVMGRRLMSAPVPESPETLRAQFKSAMNAESPRVGVLITPGEELRRVPRGFAVFDVDDGTLCLSREKLKRKGLTSVRKVREYLSRNGFTALIGKVAPVEDTSRGVTLRTEDAEGRELSMSIVPTPEDAAAQAAVDRASFPEAARQELGTAQEMAARRAGQNVLASFRRAVSKADPDAEPKFRPFPDGMRGATSLPRSSMPQVKGEHRGAMVQFLKGRGITHRREMVPAGSLEASQAEWSPEKVRRALDYEGTERALLVSSDDHVADGHHQWLSAVHEDPERLIPIIRLDAPILPLLLHMARFPSSDVDEASA